MNWSADWAWGLPLIVLTLVMHALGIGFISKGLLRVSSRIKQRPQKATVFVVVMAATTLLVACLHGMESAVWAAAYRHLGALPDNRSAMLYSLNALTSYGHESLVLEGHWELLGAMEALNGCLLFGLTTAFLFAVLQKWLTVARPEP